MFRENLVPRLLLRVAGHELRARLDDNCLLAPTLPPPIARPDVVSDVCLKLLERAGDGLRSDALDGAGIGLYENVRLCGPITANAVSHLVLLNSRQFGLGNGSGNEWKKDVWVNGPIIRLYICQDEKKG